MPNNDPTHRRGLFAVGLILVFFGVLGVLRLNPFCLLEPDSPDYLFTSRALVTLQGYTEIDHPQLTEALEPILRQLGDIHERLQQRIAKVPERRSARARQALSKVETWHRALSQLALKSLSQLHVAPGAA